MIYESPCFYCSHFLDDKSIDGQKCKAYPEGIPEEILSGDVLHDEKRPDQVGDFVLQRTTPEARQMKTIKEDLSNV